MLISISLTKTEELLITVIYNIYLLAGKLKMIYIEKLNFYELRWLSR